MTPELTDVASENDTPISAMGWFSSSGIATVKEFVDRATNSMGAYYKNLAESFREMIPQLNAQFDTYSKVPTFPAVGQATDNIFTPGTHEGYVGIVRPVSKLDYRPKYYLGRERSEGLIKNYETGYTPVEVLCDFVTSEVAPTNPYFCNLNSVYFSIYAPNQMLLPSVKPGGLGRAWEIFTLNHKRTGRKCSAECVFTDALNFANVSVSPLDKKSEMQIESYMAMLSGQDFNMDSCQVGSSVKYGKYIRKQDTSLIIGCMYPRTQYTGDVEKAKKFLSKSNGDMQISQDGNYIIRSPLDPVRYNEFQSHVLLTGN